MTKLTALKISRELEVSPQTVYAWFNGEFDSERVAQRLHELTEEAIGRRDFYARRVNTMEELLQEIQAELEAQS